MTFKTGGIYTVVIDTASNEIMVSILLVTLSEGLHAFIKTYLAPFQTSMMKPCSLFLQKVSS